MITNFEKFNEDYFYRPKQKNFTWRKGKIWSGEVLSKKRIPRIMDYVYVVEIKFDNGIIEKFEHFNQDTYDKLKVGQRIHMQF